MLLFAYFCIFKKNLLSMTNNTWSHSLFCCCSDPKVGCITFAAPCFTFGMNAEKMGHDCIWCGVCYMCLYSLPATYVRAEIRAQQSIEGSYWEDCAAETFCPCCALIQDSLEIKSFPQAAGLSMSRQWPEWNARHLTLVLARFKQPWFWRFCTSPGS